VKVQTKIVQCEGIPFIIYGDDLLCQAKSGMGKTAVFVLGVLHSLTLPGDPFQCLVICNTRELAFQISKEFERLGKYLEGLEHTQLHFGVTEARLNMKNVKIKQNALTQLKLPIEIQFGQIKELRVQVPWLSITSCPVEIHLKGMDLIVTPQEQNSWEFADIYS